MASRSSRTPATAVPAPTNGNKAQTVKLVLLGEANVGKSSLALRFVRGEYHENNEATIGAAFLTQTVPTQYKTIKFDIWDTAGQERYHSLAPMYYRGAQAAIVVYDITNLRSFERALTWIKELKQQANSQIVIVLAGNKADMASEGRLVNKEEAQGYAEDEGIYFAETSAKTGMACSDIFMVVANTMAKQNQNSQTGTNTGNRPVRLKDATDGGRKKGCC